MAEEKKFEQILSRTREFKREAEELRKTSEKLMEQCEKLRRFEQEQKGTGLRRRSAA
jgi:N6-adenosine-specific RNA methylase IME4